MLVWWDEDKIRITGGRACTRFDIRSNDHTIVMAVESRRKLIISVPFRIERQVKDDQTRSGVAELVDQLGVDRPGPGESLAHLLQHRRITNLFRVYPVQLLGSFIDPQKDEIIMHLGAPRFFLQFIAEADFFRPDAIGENDASKSDRRADQPGAKRAD